MMVFRLVIVATAVSCDAASPISKRATQEKAVEGKPSVDAKDGAGFAKTEEKEVDIAEKHEGAEKEGEMKEGAWAEKESRKGGRGGKKEGGEKSDSGEKPARGEKPEGEKPALGEKPEGEKPLTGEKPEGEKPVDLPKPTVESSASGVAVLSSESGVTTGSASTGEFVLPTTESESGTAAQRSPAGVEERGTGGSSSSTGTTVVDRPAAVSGAEQQRADYVARASRAQAGAGGEPESNEELVASKANGSSVATLTVMALALMVLV